MDEDPDAQAELFRVARAVFAATWREALGRRWPNLAGDVDAPCDLALCPGFARGSVLSDGRVGSERPHRPEQT